MMSCSYEGFWLQSCRNILQAMGKNAVVVSRRDAKRKAKKSKDEMVFPRPSSALSSRDPRQRNLSDILAGLKYLRAPVESSLQTDMGGSGRQPVGFSSPLF